MRHHIMDALYGLVIATLILAGVWVGYHSWEESMMDDGSYDKAEPHGATTIIIPEDRLLTASYAGGTGPVSPARGS